MHFIFVVPASFRNHKLSQEALDTELYGLCAERELDSKGNKSQLLQRVLDYYFESEGAGAVI
jgi:hypothetical protein